jgi:hypothetical protein
MSAKYSMFCLTWAFLFSAFAGEEATNFPVPRVFLLDARHLQLVKQKIAEGDRHFTPALEQLEQDAQDALAHGTFSVVDKKVVPPSGDKHDYMSLAPYFWPDPDRPDGLPYIRHDGEHNPDIKRISDHRTMFDMAGNAETLALAYYFKGDERYAAKARQLVAAWFFDPATRMNPNLQYAQGIPGKNAGRGIGIIESRALTQVLDAVGLLAGSKAWTAEDQRRLQAWFEDYLRWLQTSKNGKDEAAAKNNHGTYYDIQTACFALFLGKDAMASNILWTAERKRIAVQIEPDGRQPLELARTRAWGYSTANLGGLMQLATLGNHCGLDLWNFQTSDGRGIREAVDFLLPYGLREKKWNYQQLGGWSPNGFYSLLRRAAVEYPQGPYRSLLAKIPPVDPGERGILLRATELNE